MKTFIFYHIMDYYYINSQKYILKMFQKVSILFVNENATILVNERFQKKSNDEEKIDFH